MYMYIYTRYSKSQYAEDTFVKICHVYEYCELGLQYSAPVNPCINLYLCGYIYYRYIYRRQTGYEPTGGLRSAKSMRPQPQPLPPLHQQLYYAELYAAAHTSTVTKQPPSLPPLPRQTPFLR